MGQYALILTPFGKQPLTINLFENDERRLPIDRIIEQSDKSWSVFADLSYDVQLICNRLADVQNIFFYVNDCFEQCRYQSGQIRFLTKGGGDRKIFLDCYGFVEISIVIQFADETEARLHSSYLPVLVKKGALNNSVKAMADYIYDNQEEMLLNGEWKLKNISGLKESDNKSLESQIILIEEIVSIYESNYGYFKANCRFKIEKVDVVDRLEKLQYITPKTLQYTVRHPEQLRQVSGITGVHISKRTYHPERTMITQNVYSTDIYENRVIVGFLRTMIASVLQLIQRINDLLTKLPYKDIPASDYVYSPGFIFSGTRKLLVDGIKKLSTSLGKLEQLWGLYNDAMHTAPEQVERMPKPTAIFLSVPQYNKIFIRIHQWFGFGIYDLGKENFMLSFIKVSYLYESYLLVKLINYFKEGGMELITTKKCPYPVPDKWKYKNTSFNNTFIFTGSEHKITLFYQPVIFDTDKSYVNGIGLYRNNTISLNNDSEDERRGHYYVPDFLIKIDTGNSIRYVICDAKFSSLSTVQNYYISNLVYKYLFSISPVNRNDMVSGLCIIYGQCVETDILQTVYDKQLTNDRIMPFAEMLPLIEDIQNDKHFERIKQLLSKF